MSIIGTSTTNYKSQIRSFRFHLRLRFIYIFFHDYIVNPIKNKINYFFFCVVYSSLGKFLVSYEEQSLHEEPDLD